MVSFCCKIFLLCAAALVLTFFIAGLLFICASSTSITWERTASRRRPAFSSHLLTSVETRLGHNEGEGHAHENASSHMLRCHFSRHSTSPILCAERWFCPR